MGGWAPGHIGWVFLCRAKSKLLLRFFSALVGMLSAMGCTSIHGAKSSTLALPEERGVIRPLPLPPPQASLFLVADRHFGTRRDEIARYAPFLDFVWSADHYPEDFFSVNSKIELGHYMPLNTTGGHDYARCVTSCPGGNTCAPIFDVVYRHSYRWIDESVCRCAPGDECSKLSTEELRLSELEYWVTNHPDWILFKEGAPPVLPDSLEDRLALVDDACWYPDKHLLFLDFTNPEVQDYLIATNLNHIDLLGDLISTLSLDNVKLTNAYQCRGAYRYSHETDSFEWVELFDGAPEFDSAECASDEGFCDIRFTNGVMEWIAILSRTMRGAGFRLVASLSYDAPSRGNKTTELIPPDNSRMMELFERYLDGVFDEYGFTLNKNRQGDHPGMGGICWSYAYDGLYDKTYNCSEIWTFGGHQNIWSQYADGYIALADKLQIPYYSKNGVWELYSRLYRAEQDRALEWALASYFLARGVYSSFYFCENPDHNMPRNFADFLPRMTVEIGRPCGRKESSGLLHTREYSKGFVAAYVAGHPDMTGGPECVMVELPPLPAGEVYYRWDQSSCGYNDRVDPRSEPFVELCFQEGLVLLSTYLLCSGRGF